MCGINFFAILRVSQIMANRTFVIQGCGTNALLCILHIIDFS